MSILHEPQAARTGKGFTILNGLPEKTAANDFLERPCIQRFIFVLLVILFSLGLWIKPNISDHDPKYCFWDITINKYIEQKASCDSIEFIAPANDLSLLLGPDSKRQDRPGTILFAHFISRPLVWFFDRYLTARKAEKIVRKIGDREIAIPILHIVAYYVGFLVLNFMVLRLSYVLYLRAIGFSGATGEAARGASALLGVLVFANNTTKEFLWSAHTQMFSILAAMMAVCYFKAIQDSEKPAAMLCALSFLCGIGMLFYGLFVIPVAIICLGYLWRQRNIFFNERGKILRLLPQMFLAVLLFVIPYGLWYAYILHRNGAFYHYDIETFKGFTWLPSLATKRGWGAAGLDLSLAFWDMCRGAFSQGWGFLLFSGALMIMARGEETKEKATPLWIGAGLYAFFTAIFFSLYGITPLRLSYSMVAVLFPVIGFHVRLMEQKARRSAPIFIATIAGLLFYIVFMVAKFGPYGTFTHPAG